MRLRLGRPHRRGCRRVRGRRRRRRRPEPAEPELAERAASTLTDGNAFLVCELWRALVETGAVAVEDGSRSGRSRRCAELGNSGERPRGRQPAARAARSRRPPSLLELAAVAGPEFELDDPAPRPAPAELELLAALDQAIAQRHDRGACPARRSLTASPTSWCGAPLYDRLSAAAPRRAAPADRRGAGGGAIGRRGPRAGRPRPPLRRGGADRRRGAGGRVQPPRRAGGVGGARLRRGRRPLCAGARAGHRGRAPSAPSPARARDGAVPGGQVARGAAGVPPGGGDRPRAAATASCSPRRRSASRTTCWRPGLADEGARRAARGGVDRARRRRLRAAGRVCSPASPARSTSQGSPSEPRSSASDAIALARAHRRPAAGWRRCSWALYWSRGTTACTEILEMLTEARELADELGDVEMQAEAIEWRVPAFIALGEIVPARRGARGRPEHGRATRASRSCIHVAEHYRVGARALEGHLAEAEAAAERSREWGQLLDRPRRLRHLRHPDVRHPPRAGPPGRARPGDPGPRRRRPGEAARGVPASRRCSPSSGWRSEARARARPRARRGPRAVPRVALARVAHLPHRRAQRARRHEAIAALVYPELAPLAGTNVMIGHLVACYGSADRYLGMLAATLGERDQREEPLRAGARRSTGRWARRPGSRTPPTSTGACCSRAGTTPSARAALLAEAAVLAGGSGCRAARRGRRARTPVAPPAAARRPLRAARPRSSGWSRAG